MLLLLLTFNCFSQDPILLLKNDNPLYINPAFTGNENYSRVSVNYRNHFPAIGNGFVTYSTSFDTYFSSFNSGLGVSILHDRPGNKTYSYSSGMIAYSYKIKFNENYSLRLGLLSNFYYSLKDPSKLTFPDMINVDGSVSENTQIYNSSKSLGVDMGTGFLFNTKWLNAGTAIYHIGSKSDSSYHHRQIRFNAHIDLYIPLFKKQTYANPQTQLNTILKESYLNPYIYYWQQGYSKILSAGIDLHAKNLCIGLSGRQDWNFKSLIFSAHLGFKASFMEVNYIFDIGKIGDNFKGLSTSSHEIGIIFKFGEEKDD